MALPVNCSVMHAQRVISHASRHPPDVILRTSFTGPSTTLGDRRPGNEATEMFIFHVLSDAMSA